MRTKVYEIPGKLTVEWDPSAKAIIDTWETYSITLKEFKEAVLIKGVNHAKNNGGIAWIVDSHKATGVFSQEIHKFIETDVFPTFAKIGIKFFMTTDSEQALTKLTISQYSTAVGPCGMKLLKGSSAAGAIEWLTAHQQEHMY